MSKITISQVATDNVMVDTELVKIGQWEIFVHDGEPVSIIFNTANGREWFDWPNRPKSEE